MSKSRCPRCHRQLVVITIESGDRPMTLRSCSNCDVREWTTADATVPLDGVLDDLSRDR